MDAEMASWKSTGTYVDEVPPPGANIVSGMWIFRVKRPPGSPPAFKARYVARGFSQQQGVDFFQTFSPTSKMTTLRVLLHVAAQRDYELHSLDFSTALRQTPREWHDTLRTTLAVLGFAPSTSDPSLFLRTDTTLPSFYVLVYVDDLVFATADTEALAHVKAQCTISLTQSHMVQRVLQRFGFMYSSPQSTPLPTSHSLSAPPSDESYIGHGARVVLTGHADASWVDDLATQRSSQGYTFSLGSGFVSWRSTCSSSVLSLSCEAEIYAGAMAAQGLRWLTYLLTDLGEVPRSPPVLYVDNKAMLALCQEHRLEHRTKHIALRYFLARELQQRGQLRLAYVASQANTADVFTKALQPCDHQQGFTGSFPEGTQWSLRRPVYGLRKVPREWHDPLTTTLAALGFAPSTADLSLFLRTNTTLPPFYILVYVYDMVFATADTKALALVKAELQERHTYTDLGPSVLRLPVLFTTAHSSVYRSLALSSTFARFRRAEWSIPRACGLPHVHFDSAKRVLRYVCSTLGMGFVLGGRGSVVLTGHSGASWTNDQATQHSSHGYTFSLGSGSVSWRSTRSPPHGQLRLAYVASRANTADVFTKALGSGDHQRFCTALGRMPTLPHLLVA
ncbi:unnamed protein product [Closterium sp. NIES-53]